MVVPESKRDLRLGSQRIFQNDRWSETRSGPSSFFDETSILQPLKDLAATGSQKLDTILQTVAETALRRTGATGAAIAMWKEGCMVCRARCGETAPPLGATLSADTGISGECLRTGQKQYCSETENDPRVDLEVCRGLGLRSIAVLPIQGWRGINGILEVFSTEPDAFSKAHIAFLQQLAAVAERARTFQPQGASALAKSAEEPSILETPQVSDRVRDIAAIFLRGRSRPFVIAGAVLAMFLLGAAIWLGWRGPAEASPTSSVAAPAVSRLDTRQVSEGSLLTSERLNGEKLPLQKSSAGIPVKLASDVQVLRQPRNRADQPLLAADAAAMSSVPYRISASEEEMLVEAPSLPVPDLNTSELNTVLGSTKPDPQLSESSISSGITSGRLIQQVHPTYPPQALLMRLEGKVVLTANIYEDGTVHDLRVVQGDPVLAKSVIAAVRRWRYKPYELDGRLVKAQTTITVNFKLPTDTASR